MAENGKQSGLVVQTQRVRVIDTDAPLELTSGKTLAPVDVAYETYGTLNENKSNAILIIHALSGDAHVAGRHSEQDKKPGWWDEMVGPGKPIDTDKYFVICSNCLGGCSGTTGPSDLNPKTQRPYGLDFPIITIADMVTVQKLLVEKLGIDKLLTVVGGSMGGMQVMQWALAYPEMVNSAIVIASTTRLGAQAIAFDTVGRNAITADAWFQNGQYHDSTGPRQGLAIARMIGHITYLSEEGMRAKFGRELRHADQYSYDLDSEFSVETYLAYKGRTFVERFDANSYLYITKAMDYFDLEREYGSLGNAFAGTQCPFLIVSFSSDWLFSPDQSEEIVTALTMNRKPVTYCNVESPYGHDAFLLEPETLGKVLSGFLRSTLDRLESRTGLYPIENGEGHVKPVEYHRVRVDYELIESLIEPGASVLDVGCGDGELLARLIADKEIRGEGVEVNEKFVVSAIHSGLSIVHRDAQRGLGLYPDKRFDYVILSQTLQTIQNPGDVFEELLRIGKKVIVSFPNFAHWKCRLQLALYGMAPRTGQLPFEWHNTPNIHFLSMKDFDRFCEKHKVEVLRRIPLIETSARAVRFAPNWFAEQAVYLLSK